MPLAPLLAFGLMASAMTLSVVVALTVRPRRTDVAGLVALLVLSAGSWLLSNRPFAGQLLVTLVGTHGLHAADLFALAPLAVAAWLVARTVEQGHGD